MRRTLFCITMILGGVFFLFNSVEAATYVSTDITESTTWSPSGSPYVITRSITLSDTLKIQGGTVVKLGPSVSIYVNSSGSLEASGAVFTSLYDNDYGGNTDPEGDDIDPGGLSDWASISSEGTLTFDDCKLFYGGPANRALVEVQGGNAVVTKSSFRYANNAILQSNGTATVQENLFTDITQHAVWQTEGVITFGSNSFEDIEGASYLITKETFTNKGGNKGEGTVHLFGLAFQSDKVLVSDTLPYQITDGKIKAGATLIVEEGNILKLWNATNAFVNDGTLQVQGTREKPVVITSVNDDLAGGDSNKDGKATVGEKGQWGRIYNTTFGTLDFTYTIVRYGGSRVGSESGLIVNYGTVRADHSTFSDSATRLLLVQQGKVDIEKSELLRAEEALVSNGQAEVNLHTNDILQTSSYRIRNSTTGKSVDASNNYWGNETGPVVRGNVNLGPVVSLNVNINPYLSSSSLCKADCFSNVLFLPGIMGSRLYETQGVDEDELWFSSLDDRQERMEMKNDGTSKYDVYTKEGEAGMVDAAYGNLYQSFLNDLAAWKTEGLFNNYALIPYDWRLSLEDVVMNGKVENGKLSYTSKNADITQSYLYQQAKALQQSSKSERIILIGHSNGGLVIKAFIQKLKEINDPLYDQIDKVIFVGVPQTGTSDSVVSLLYGSKIGILWIGTSAKRARFLAHDMPTMYNLLPSQKLFNQLDPLIEFKGDNVPTEWKERYGNSINSYEEFEDFLQGKEGRERPEYKDLLSPEVLSGDLFDQAQDVHNKLDNWAPAPTTEIIQIAGWGLYTVAGLEVVDDKKCKFDINQLKDSRPVCYLWEPATTIRDKQILDGDGTVLEKSAHAMVIDSKSRKYWVNLLKYNSVLELNKDRVHKDILEVDTLRYFIKSIIQNNPQLYDYVDESKPSLPNNVRYTEYKIHSPLYITLTDESGNVTGWDAASGQIVENIKGAQYSEIGEIKSVLVPKEVNHTVTLQAYDSGSFTLDIVELEGEQQVSETQFVAIPVLQNTMVKVATVESGSAVMNIDFNNDGTSEIAFLAQSGEEVEYPNPIQGNENTSSEDSEDDTKDSGNKKKGSLGSNESLQNILNPLSKKEESRDSYFQLPVTDVSVNQENKEKRGGPLPDQPQDSSESQNLLAYGVAAKGARLERLLVGLKRILKLKK